jgi:hypothetical protein
MDTLIYTGWMVLFFGSLIGAAVIASLDDHKREVFYGVLVLAILSICAIVYGNIHLAEYTLTHGERITEYAQVRSVNPKSIILDNMPFSYEDNAVSKAYPIDLSQFHVGEIVKYDYLKLNSTSYLIEIEKYTGQ